MACYQKENIYKSDIKHLAILGAVIFNCSCILFAYEIKRSVYGMLSEGKYIQKWY